MLDDMRDIMDDYCRTGSSILFGHSKWSLLAQQFVDRYGEQHSTIQKLYSKPLTQDVLHEIFSLLAN